MQSYSKSLVIRKKYRAGYRAHFEGERYYYTANTPGEAISAACEALAKRMTAQANKYYGIPESVPLPVLKMASEK